MPSAPEPAPAMSEPRTARGAETKRRIFAAAEEVFSEQGYLRASVSRITERAGVGQGTFYLYFASKLDLFEALVDDLNQRVRRAMTEGAARGATRAQAEAEGFRAFFAFAAEHPAFFRVMREAEQVAPDAMRRHYERIAAGYAEGLARARVAGEIGDVDPEVAAWALMGIGELVGMRWVLWPHQDGEPAPQVPDAVLDQMMRLIRGALDAKEDA